MKTTRACRPELLTISSRVSGITNSGWLPATDHLVFIGCAIGIARHPRAGLPAPLFFRPLAPSFQCIPVDSPFASKSAGAHHPRMEVSAKTEWLLEVVCRARKMAPQNVVKCCSGRSPCPQNVSKCYHLERKAPQFPTILAGAPCIDLTFPLPKPVRNRTGSCMILSEPVMSISRVTNRPPGAVI